jgi:hypothetical protein
MTESERRGHIINILREARRGNGSQREIERLADMALNYLPPVEPDIASTSSSSVEVDNEE